MKTLLLFFGFVALTCQMVNAQNTVFVNGNGENMTDTVYVVHDISETAYLNEHKLFKIDDGYIQNKTNTTVHVKLKREVLEYVSDSALIDKWEDGNFEWYYPRDQFCWGDNCTYLGSNDITYELGPSPVDGQVKVSLDLIEYEHFKLIGKTTLKYSIIIGSTLEDVLVVVFQITGTTSSMGNAKSAEPTIYPNPVRGTLNISNLDKAQKVLVSNVLGQPVFTTTSIQQNMQVDFSNLNNGVYFVSIHYANNKVITQRLVKQ